jgi:hypothetical protein
MGIVGGINILQPRTINADNTKATQKVKGWDVAAFVKHTQNVLTLKLYGIYGANLSPFAMLGGFAPAVDPATDINYAYSSLLTYSVWSEAMYKAGSFDYGMFVGYSANAGTSADGFYYASQVSRGADIKNLIRVSPRATYTAGRVVFGAEYMLTGATYMDVKPTVYEAAKTDDMVFNNRYYLSATYTF